MTLIADAGGTKTEWCIVGDGVVVRRIATAGMNPFHQSEEETDNILREQLLPALADVTVDDVYFYGSGCRDERTTGMRDCLRATLVPRLRGNARNNADACIHVYSDVFGAARSLYGDGAGIVCIIGTGSNACLYDGREIAASVPPLGFILGDEGSGAAIGRAFLNAILKRRFGEDLRAAYLHETCQSEEDILRKVYSGQGTARFLASAAPFVLKHIERPELREMVIDSFSDFFRINVLPLCKHAEEKGRDDRMTPVKAVGSIAYFFRAELARAAEDNGLVLAEAVQSPMGGLIRYHLSSAHSQA